MGTPVLLTIDLGTTNCKVVAFSINGELIASSTQSYPTLSPREGWYEQRVADWLGSVTSALQSISRDLDSRVQDIAGLAMSAWGPGLLLLGARSQLLTDRSPTWQDTRSHKQGRKLVDDVGDGWVGGGMPLTGFPAKLAWMLENRPDIAAKATMAVGVKDYLLQWLTGVLVTESSSGPYADRWDTDVFDSLGWPVKKLPEIVSPTTVIGSLDATVATHCGLPPGIPVVAGLNDGAAATLGVGAHRVGDAVVSLGTNGVFRLVTARPVSAETCLTSSLFRYPLLGDLWACGGFVLSGGSALAWFADAVSATPVAIDDLLRAAGEVPPGSDSVTFLPYLVGRGSPRPDPGAAAAFLGLRPRHRQAHLARAVLEGVAFGAKDIADALAALDLHPKQLFVTGGGAVSPLWRAIFADVLGLPAAYTLGDSNLGLAIVLTISLGITQDLSGAVRQLVPEPIAIPASTENATAYTTAYRAYRSAAERLGE